MNSNLLNFVVVEVGKGLAVTDLSFDANDFVLVRDDWARYTATIAAADISLYRHSIMLAGKAYRILSIVRQRWQPASRRVDRTSTTGERP